MCAPSAIKRFRRPKLNNSTLGYALSEQRWSLAQIVTILTNCGVDVTCNACTEVAFTGSTTAKHTCAVKIDNSEWYYVEGVRYCTVCRTRRCIRQPGGMLPCPPPFDDAEPLFTLRAQDWVAPDSEGGWKPTDRGNYETRGFGSVPHPKSRKDPATVPLSGHPCAAPKGPLSTV